MNFNALNTVVATLFLIMAVGFCCRKFNIIDNVASKRLSKLILTIGQPALLIHSLSSAEYSEKNVKMAGLMIILGFVFHGVLAIVSYFIAKPLKKVPDEQKITEFALMFANCAFIGFPIFEALLPESGIFMASFLTISFNILLWTWGLGIFARGRTDIKMTLKKVFFNFGTVPCVIGFALYLLKHPAIGFQIPEFATKGMQYLTNLCTPISVLVTGALIATQKPKQIFCSWKLYYFNIMKLIVLPILICLISKLIGLPKTYALFFTAAAALPSASSVAMMSETYGLDAGYSSLTVGTSSFLSVLTLPFTMFISQFIFSI